MTVRSGRTGQPRAHPFGIHIATGLIGLMALTPLLAACSNSDDDAASSATEPPAAAETTAGSASGGDSLSGGGATSETTPDGSDGGSGTPVIAPPAGDRKLIITITVGLEVDDVATAVNKVIALAGVHGGELSRSSVDLSRPEVAGGDLVFRIPPEETDAFIAGLDPGIGRRTGLQTASEDVTLQVADLATRIENARASLDRVRRLLAEAKDVGEVIALESELTKRENTLEELLAQQIVLNKQVAMSTVTVHLSPTPEEPEVVPDTTPSDSVGDAFRDGWHAFSGFVGGVVKFVGYTLPFLVIFAVGGLVAWRVMARRSRSAAPPPPPAPAEGPRTSEPGS